MPTLGAADNIACGRGGSGGSTLGTGAAKRDNLLVVTLGAGTGVTVALNDVAAGQKSKVASQNCFQRCGVVSRVFWVYHGRRIGRLNEVSHRREYTAIIILFRLTCFVRFGEAASGSGTTG